MDIHYIMHNYTLFIITNSNKVFFVCVILTCNKPLKQQQQQQQQQHTRSNCYSTHLFIKSSTIVVHEGVSIARSARASPSYQVHTLSISMATDRDTRNLTCVIIVFDALGIFRMLFISDSLRA